MDTAAQSIAFLLALGLAGALYFCPFIVALARGHPSTGAIFVIDLFLGWTLVGWVAALAWALVGLDAREGQDATAGRDLPPDAAAEVTCSTCGTRTHATAGICPRCGAALRRTPCPFCAEMIRPIADVCPYCHRDLPDAWPIRGTDHRAAQPD